MSDSPVRTSLHGLISEGLLDLEIRNSPRVMVALVYLAERRLLPMTSSQVAAALGVSLRRFNREKARLPEISAVGKRVSYGKNRRFIVYNYWTVAHYWEKLVAKEEKCQDNESPSKSSASNRSVGRSEKP